MNSKLKILLVLGVMLETALSMRTANDSDFKKINNSVVNNKQLLDHSNSKQSEIVLHDWEYRKGSNGTQVVGVVKIVKRSEYFGVALNVVPRGKGITSANVFPGIALGPPGNYAQAFQQVQQFEKDIGNWPLTTTRNEPKRYTTTSSSTGTKQGALESFVNEGTSGVVINGTGCPIQ